MAPDVEHRIQSARMRERVDFRFFRGLRNALPLSILLWIGIIELLRWVL